MYLNEIKFHQSKYFDCVSKFLDDNLDRELKFVSTLEKTCHKENQSLEDFYTPYLEKATLNKKFYNRKLYAAANS